METESIYGPHLPAMKQTMDEILLQVEQIRGQLTKKYGSDPIEHCLSRIKSEESMREKCRRNGLPETTESALSVCRDAIGIRIVCAFLDDVYLIRDHLKTLPGLTLAEEKDYIRNAKQNGYRSYHMIFRAAAGYYVEVQLRTISMDTWAALEHHMKYKKGETENEALIVSELKRCADELASTDVSMQIIRRMIFDEKNGGAA